MSTVIFLGCDDVFDVNYGYSQKLEGFDFFNGLFDLSQGIQ